MCDYSLDLVASRPAKVGDKLVSTRFPSSTTRGFASVEERNVAVFGRDVQVALGIAALAPSCPRLRRRLAAHADSRAERRQLIVVFA